MAGQKNKDFEQQVLEVLGSFDFDRVHRIMQFLDRVPTRGELFAEAGRLLRELEGKPGVHGSGGLRASCKDDGQLSLKFVVCESWSDTNDDSGLEA